MKNSVLMRRLSKREETILWVCLSMVFIYVCYQGIYKFWSQKILILDGKITASQEQLSKKLNVIQKSKMLDEGQQRYLDQFKQTVSDERMMSVILSEIQEIAKQIDMRINNMKPRRVKKIDFYNNFSVNLSFEGSLNEITHFLHALQSPPHFFTVDELRLDQKSLRSSVLICNLVISKISIP